MASDRSELLARLDREMRTLASHATTLLSAAAARAGLSAGDLSCLLILTAEGPMTAGRLAERAGLTTGAVTGVIDRLEKAGYAGRERDPGDRRRVIVAADAERVEREISPLFAPLEQAAAGIGGAYSDADLALIAGFLERSAPLLADEAARLRRPEDSAAAPLGGISAGRLEWGTGVAWVTLRADPNIGDLYRAHFEGAVPTVRVREGTVSVHHRRFGLFDWGKHRAELTLNSSIPWEIEAKGGMSSIRGELRNLDLLGLSVSGGVSDVELDLGSPRGTVPIRASGGASRFVVRRPAGAPVRVLVKGGASSILLDGETRSSWGGREPWATPGWDTTENRYDFELSGGASSFEIHAA